jgi:hypothetical protein
MILSGRNLLLQHWTGEVNELGHLSMQANAAYAGRCGADYRFLEGNVFDPAFCPFVQKMIILDQRFDDYDVVAMTDMDMFPRRGSVENLFTDAQGVGVCDEGNRKNTFARLLKGWPKYSSSKHPFWGGSIYRFERSIRVKLRSQFPKMGLEWDMWNSKGGPVDEGLMHRCAMLANLPLEGMHLPDRWSRGHFHPLINEACFIHIRNGKRKPNGDRIDATALKIDNYRVLHGMGII